MIYVDKNLDSASFHISSTISNCADIGNIKDLQKECKILWECIVHLQKEINKLRKENK